MSLDFYNKIYTQTNKITFYIVLAFSKLREFTMHFDAKRKSVKFSYESNCTITLPPFHTNPNLIHKFIVSFDS